MLIGAKFGRVDYARAPVPINCRGRWEFAACFEIPFVPLLEDKYGEEGSPNTLWAFPPSSYHGWQSDQPSERLVFQFSLVSEELERFLPSCGYYRVELSPDEVLLLKEAYVLAKKIEDHPTELMALQTRTLVGELSLLALKGTRVSPLSASGISQVRTAQAEDYFREHMAEGPSLSEIARAVHVSPAHLRRLFHQARGESPQRAFNRIRMTTVKECLRRSDLTLELIASRVGLTSLSVLSRATKSYFGESPKKLRSRLAPQR